MSTLSIYLRQGDATTLTSTITSGMTSLTGYTAKMYVTTKVPGVIKTFDGTINGLVITYDIVNEDSKLLSVGSNEYEMKLFDTSDHVYTYLSGLFIVEKAINKDPS